MEQLNAFFSITMNACKINKTPKQTKSKQTKKTPLPKMMNSETIEETNGMHFRG